MGTESLESCFSSMASRVEFNQVQDQYSYNDNLICKFSLIDYTVQEGDRIAIFKLGWQYIREYILFEWVPKDPEDGNDTVMFNKLCLPRSTEELYQFCYISGENVMHGASEPFQFCDKPSRLYQSLPFTSGFTGCESLPQAYSGAKNKFQNTGKLTKNNDLILERLKEENKIFRETLKVLLTQNKTCSHDKDINDLKKTTEKLHTMLMLQQTEIKDLKRRIAESGEEYRKIYVEKAKVERKYEKLKNKQKEEEVLNNLNKTNEEVNLQCFELGELASIPPFPFANVSNNKKYNYFCQWEKQLNLKFEKAKNKKRGGKWLVNNSAIYKTWNGEHLFKNHTQAIKNKNSTHLNDVLSLCIKV